MTTTDTGRCPNCFAAAGTPCPKCGWQPGQDNPPPALALGQVLDGRYRIGRVLGHGGFGITYLAWDDNLQLRLAIKEYFPRDSAGRGADGVSLAVYSGPAREQFAYGLDRFLEEARTLARFDQHPGIVTVKNFFRAHGTGYCVMDYVAGITLRQYLEQQPGGRIGIEAALKLLMPVADALRAVHKEGLLHRDLAPDNIYLTQDGRIKLLDFGAARFAASEHSKSLSIILKPGYAPEEQYRTRGNQGPWTDVYGLAATLYRAITGQVPPEALDRLDHDDLVPPSQMGIPIKPEQEVALLQALAVKAGQRFQGMAKLQAAWRGGGGAAPPPAGGPGGSVPLAAAVAPNAKPVTRPSAQGGAAKPVDADMVMPPEKNSNTVLIALIVIGGLVILALVLMGQQEGQQRSAQTTLTPAPGPSLVAEGEQALDQGDYERARAILSPLAAAGNATAQFYMGLAYENGQGVSQDAAEAVRWYRKAAEQGDADAQYNLGLMYNNGRGVAQDDAEAVRWYRKAEEQGLAEAQTNLGVMYEDGRGVPQDAAEAVRWYRKAAEQGSAVGQDNLGLMYATGQGVAQNAAEAVRWYRKAAEQGLALGQVHLGAAYAKGLGVAKDDAEAVRWFRKAAEQGLAAGQFNLGGMYEDGQGVRKSIKEAKSWYRKAAEQGDADAKAALERLGK